MILLGRRFPKTKEPHFMAGGSEQDGKDRLKWLRGDKSNELPDGPFRTRNKVLGDIVNSDPVYVAVSNFGYDRLPDGTAGKDTYTSFREQNLPDGIRNRRKMLYIGANDGMLHAFDALTGEEIFAYVPQGVFDNLASLSDPDYTHKYFVDGTAHVGDAYINDTWRTILVGTTGAGGRSVFALDITDPDSFDASKVLWNSPPLMILISDILWANQLSDE
jgi:type IV pilus assembly protein PilY1